MFFRKSKTINPIMLFKNEIQHTLRDLVFLSDGLAALIEKIESENKIQLSILNLRERKIIASKTFDGLNAEIIVLSSETIILNLHLPGLQTVCHILKLLTLERNDDFEDITGNINLKHGGCLLNDGRLATLAVEEDKQQNHRTTYKIKLLIHDFKTKQFNQTGSQQILMTTSSLIYVTNLRQLITGNLAFRVNGHNDSFFKIFILEKNEKNGFEYHKGINPITDESTSSFASGNYTPLFDGKLLTYHSSGRNFQIWENTQCSDKWSWHTKEIICTDDKYNEGFWSSKAAPLPDGKHLLILAQSAKLFLFNTQTRNLQAINIGNLEPWNVFVRPNGEIIINTMYWDETSKKRISGLLYIDLNQMILYRDEVKKLLEKSARLYDVLNKLVEQFLDLDTYIKPEEISHSCRIM